MLGSFTGWQIACRRVVAVAMLAWTFGLGAGCSTLSRQSKDEHVRSLRPTPSVPTGHRRADRAILCAFFEANGAKLSLEEAERIIPHTAPRGRMDRNHLRQIARDQRRLLLVVKADERYLWEELAHNRPLLILLPPGSNYSAAPTPLIPVSWDRRTGTIDLLDGNGEVHPMDARDFFVRREPLKHAALCLIRPGAMKHLQPTREQKLLLADFWYHRGAYRRAEIVYTSVQATTPDIVDVDALVGRANALVAKEKYSEAIPLYRRALAIDPDNPKILNNLAYCLLHGGGDLLTALRHAHKALDLDSENPLVLETLGSINLKLGDGETAAKYLEMAWARALRRPEEIQIAIMDQLVRAWLAAHREDLAWQVASHRHRTFPQYRFPRDLLQYFPVLRQPPGTLPSSLPSEM